MIEGRRGGFPSTVSSIGIIGEGRGNPNFLGKFDDRSDDLGAWTHRSLSSLLPGTDYSISKSWNPAMHMEPNEFHMTQDEMAPSADQATQATGGLWDSVHELDGRVGDPGGTVDLAALGTDDIRASMGVGRQEALAYAGEPGGTVRVAEVKGA